MNLQAKKQLLFVDDEEDVLHALVRCLRNEPFTVHTASNSKDGLKILSQHPIAVVVADERMPGVSGYNFLEKVKTLYPDTIRLILTGYADAYAAVQAINKGEVFRYLAKPWDDNELKITLRQAIERFDLTQQNRFLHRMTIKQNRELKEGNNRLKKSFEQTLQLISGIIGMHSPQLGHHSARVGNLAGEIAKEMQLETTEIEDISIAGLLHDVGKCRNKSEHHQQELNANHFKEYQMHPEIGFFLLNEVDSFKHISEMVLQHHEHGDGSGFPNSLFSKDILLGAKIIAAANALDHEQYSIESDIMLTNQEAIARLEQSYKKWLDPEVVTVLKTVVEKRNAVEKTPTPEVNTNEEKIEPKNQPSKLNMVDLEPGMKLAQDVYASGGVLLFPRGSILDNDNIALLNKYESGDSLLGQIFINRSTSTMHQNTTSKRSFRFNLGGYNEKK